MKLTQFRQRPLRVTALAVVLGSLRLPHIVAAAFAMLLFAGCTTTPPTELRFSLGTNTFLMKSSKEVSAGLMTFSTPDGMAMVVSNYVSHVSSPNDVLSKAIDAYLKSRP